MLVMTVQAATAYQCPVCAISHGGDQWGEATADHAAALAADGGAAVADLGAEHRGEVTGLDRVVGGVHSSDHHQQVDDDHHR
jgi:hypothetical protein